ncbi:MAG: secretin N-terminal domain-containing protein [Gemmatimonadota bacterium]
MILSPWRSGLPRGTGLLLAFLLVFGTTSQSASAQQPAIQPVNGGIQLNFQDLDLAFVFTALAQAADLNLIYHDLPSKPITLRTTQPMEVEGIPALIRSLARANGIGVTDEDGFLRLQGLVTDEDEEPDFRELYIYRLRHARAPILSQTLQALFGGAQPAGQAFNRPQTLSQQITQLQGVGQGGQVGAQAPVIQLQQGSGELEGNVLIIPDEVTNSLLIRATPGDWEVVQVALQALDLRPLQVVIEVVIAEVSRSEEIDVGTTFSASGTADGADVTGALDRENAPTDGFSLEFLRTGNVDVQATLRALASTGNVQILSRPVILAQNNQEARILVGTQRPFVQVSRTLPTDEGARDEVIQYRDVGTVLTILPTINEDGYVNLLVLQEVSSATTEVQFGAPVISTREATTQLLARNGQTVVLGGLVDRQEDEVRAGIPILKDIPLLGYLFGYNRSISGSSELFLFLTPYVVATDDDADLLREQIERDAELIGPILPERTLTPTVPAPPPDGAGG